MDPTATLIRLLNAIADEDREETIAALRDLEGWIENGGFLPNLTAAIEAVDPGE